MNNNNLLSNLSADYCMLCMIFVLYDNIFLIGSYIRIKIHGVLNRVKTYHFKAIMLLFHSLDLNIFYFIQLVSIFYN